MPAEKPRLSYVDLNRPTIFAHRGSSMHAPENTLLAFQRAFEQGADAIELDVKLSADGEVVVMHDDTVDRTTNGTGRVASMTLRELKQLDAGAKWPLGRVHQEIPTLSEVFETVGGKLLINVELTNYTSPADDLPEKVTDLVRKYDLVSMALLSSFNMIALSRARTLLKNIPMGLLTLNRTARFLLSSKLIHFNPLFALHPSLADFSPALLEATHKMEARIHVYTVNQPEDMQRLFAAGVDGIFTDDPLLALKVLDRK
jgi:glycerophosphoryl diester phosphodiesterase